MACLLLSLLWLIAESAYQGLRPIIGGQINQIYLWTDETIIGGQTFYHRGIDFPGATGTAVHAIASGKVIQIYDLTNNDTFGNTRWGNFVLIRHDEKYWDRTNGSNGAESFVYSIYAHLEYDSVDLIEGALVDANEVVGSRDNTGNSSGSHLHLQVVLNSESNAKLISDDPDELLIDSENESRNPELWISPSTGKATAIGKVTNTNGIAIEDLVICGIAKITPNYTSSLSYSFDWANPDDIFYENFATTDVNVGTRNLYANNVSDGCSATPADYMYS